MYVLCIYVCVCAHMLTVCRLVRGHENKSINKGVKLKISTKTFMLLPNELNKI